jgi:hypothetical protein
MKRRHFLWLGAFAAFSVMLALVSSSSASKAAPAQHKPVNHNSPVGDSDLSSQLKDALDALSQKLDAIGKKLDGQDELLRKGEIKKPPVVGAAMNSQPAGDPTTSNSPADAPTPARAPLDALVLLAVAGLMGMVGQGARTIVGLKQLSDLSETAPSQADGFNAARLSVSLMIGFVAGIAGAVTSNKLFGVEKITADLLLYLAGIGYIGVDAIEGLTYTLGKSKPSPQSTPKPNDQAGQPAPPRKKTSLRQNQIEAYNAGVGSGLSHEAAVAFVADVTRESLAKPDDVSPDPSHANPHQKAHGIVQWDDDRAQNIKKHFGLFPQEMPVTQQVKAALWEIESYYGGVWETMKTCNDPNRIVEVLVCDYEMPADKPGETAKRQALIPDIERIVA